MDFREISSFQARTLTDLRQVYEAWQAADSEMRHRYAGSMRWHRPGGTTEYLYRKVGSVEKSLGPRSPATEQMYDSFMTGRAKAKGRLAGLVAALDTQAGVARSVGLGRVPLLVARMLRALDGAQVLGHLRIVGTNALFAYEALAAAQFNAEALATGDIDLLVDARRRIRIMVNDASPRTVLGLLRRVDKSFAVIPGKPYRVANAEGYMVDLIRPEANPPWRHQPGADALAPEDLTPSPIEGLQWLVNAPSVQTTVVDERGYPAPIVVPDPRIWLLHKVWLSRRALREAGKARRDRQQAEAMWLLVSRNLRQYPLNSDFSAGLPAPLREIFDEMQPAPETILDDDVPPPQPNW